MSIHTTTLREHATILRSLADELDAVADAADHEDHCIEHVGGFKEYEAQPLATPLDVRIDAVYQISPRIQFDGVLRMARQDAQDGKTIKLEYEGAPHKNIVLTPSNWDAEVPQP